MEETQLAALRRAIDTVFAAAPLAGQENGARVVDLETGQVIYERNAELPLIPASNTKLLTTAYAFANFGPDHQFVTEVHGPQPAGGLVSNLEIVGENDFTWSSLVMSDPALPLRELAAELAAAGVTEITGTVTVRGEFLIEGESLGTLDPAAERAQVGDAVIAAFAASGVTVGAVGADPDRTVPAGRSVLATWRSPGLAGPAALLNKTSHNEFADTLARGIGLVAEGQASYPAWDAACRVFLARAGIFEQGVAVGDGSGLSRDNRVSARTLVELIDYMLGQPEGALWAKTLAVAGIDGTIAKRLGEPDTVGRFHGKTGTLRDVIALSGVLYHRYDGRRYAGALLSNQVADQQATRLAFDSVVTAVAANNRGGALGAPAPTLSRAMLSGGDLEIAWVDTGGEVLVWLSPDGTTWTRDDAALLSGTRYRTKAPSNPVFVRLTGWNGAADGAPSAVYAAASGGAVLVVDGNDRWLNEPNPENSLGRGHDFITAYAEHLAARGFDTVDNAAVEQGTVDLAGYDVVVWMLGEESTDDESFSRAEQALVVDYIRGGGKLLVTGSEVGWDLVERGDADDAAFYRNVLGAEYIADGAGTFFARPAGAFQGRPMFFFHPGALNVMYPDAIAAGAAVDVALAYEDGTAAAVASSQVFYLAFPIEALPVAADRERLFDWALARFGR
jgi:D-alanyl-D-alanine carboxypeptidase